MDKLAEVSKPGFRERLMRSLRKSRPGADQQDVEDAVQDVLLKVYERVADYKATKEPGNWDAYMHRAVTNRLNDFYRLRARHHSHAHKLYEDVFAEGEDPQRQFETVERTALFTLLMKAVNGEDSGIEDERIGKVFGAMQHVLSTRLSDKQWILLRMRGIEGYGMQDCADALSVSLGSIHRWYNDALEICAGVLREHGLEPGQLL